MKRITIIMVLALLSAHLFSQTPGGALSLEDARTLALLNSRSLAQRNLAIDATLLTEQARIFDAYLPGLSLGARATMNLWGVNSEPTGNPLDTFNATASATISESISFQGARQSIEKAINMIASESARKDALIEYFSVLDSVDSAFYAVLEAAATLEAEEIALQSAADALAMAEIRQASGMLSAGDYLKAMADKEARDNSRNQARRSLSLANTKLRAITGLASLPALASIDFSGYEGLIAYLGGLSDADADALYARFYELLSVSNPALAKAGLADRRAALALDQAMQGYAPTLTASFETGLNYSLDGGIGWNAGMLSLSLSVPVDYWNIGNSVERSRVSRESSALDYAGAVSQLETDLQSALITALGNAGSVLSTRRSLEYADKHYEYVEERYKLSQGSVAELGEAASLLISSRNSHIRAQYGFLQSLSMLRSLGAIDEEAELMSLLMPEGVPAEEGARQ